MIYDTTRTGHESPVDIMIHMVEQPRLQQYPTLIAEWPSLNMMIFNSEPHKVVHDHGCIETHHCVITQ